jgi:hypothetical protein
MQYSTDGDLPLLPFRQLVGFVTPEGASVPTRIFRAMRFVDFSDLLEMT